MSSREKRQVDQELLDAAAMLVEEWPGVPTGSVLRCFSRAVWILRVNGCDPDRLGTEAVSLARALLHMRATMIADDINEVVRESISQSVPRQHRAGVESKERGRRGAWTPNKP